MTLINLDIIAGLIATVIVASLSFLVIRTKYQNRKIFAEFVQAEINLMAVSDKLNRILSQQDEHSIEKSDGFLKFVSESREWAFKYIEEVQLAFKKIEQEISPMVNHYRSTGKSLYRKPKEIVAKVDAIYDILISVMPQEEDDKDVQL